MSKQNTPAQKMSYPLRLTRPTVVPPDIEDFTVLLYDRMLIVEGRDDLQVFQSLLQYLRLTRIHIHCTNGKDGLNLFLRELTERGQLPRVLGVIRDADQKPQSAFDSVANLLERSGYPKPTLQQPIARSATHRSGCCVLPSPSDKGAIETLLLHSIEHKSPERLEPVIAFLNSQGFSPETERNNNWAKRVVQTYMCLHPKEPLTTIGMAALHSIWPYNAPGFKPVKQFVSQLFGERHV